MLVALLAALDRMLRKGLIIWSAVWLIPLAAITRIDAIVAVGALVATFVGLWLPRHRNARAITFTAVALLPWIMFMAWRWRYFGQLIPNTAAAQSISVVGRLMAIARSPSRALADEWAWFDDVGQSLFAFQLLWLVPLGLYLRREQFAMNRLALIVTGVVACLAEYAMFGRARMDPSRTVTEITLWAAATVPFLLLGVQKLRREHFLLGFVMLGPSVAFAATASPHRSDIGWGAANFEGIAENLDRIAAEDDIPRPMIANPDLGAVSWRKHFNVLDLGRLGSSVIPRVASFANYVVLEAQPDIIELHVPWSCQNPELFNVPEFKERYRRISPPATGRWQCAGTDAKPSFWVRRAIEKGSGSPERRFLDSFRERFDLELVRLELSRCLSLPGQRPCDYVGRTLFRFHPELVRAGHEKAVADLLSRDPRLTVEHAFFTSSVDPRWWRAVVDVKDAEASSVSLR
jgi:hypothetical protein